MNTILQRHEKAVERACGRTDDLPYSNTALCVSWGTNNHTERRPRDVCWNTGLFRVFRQMKPQDGFIVGFKIHLNRSNPGQKPCTMASFIYLAIVNRIFQFKILSKVSMRSTLCRYGYSIKEKKSCSR